MLVMPAALIVYLCMFAAGFLFLALSFIFGADHHAAEVGHGDVGGHDVAHDVSHGVGHQDVGHHDVGDKTYSPSIFSTRVIACFLMGFGIGATLSHTWITHAVKLPWKYGIDLSAGIVGGLVFGFLCWFIIKLIFSQQFEKVFRLEEFIGRQGQLSLPIPEKGIGEIALVFDETNRTLSVRSEDGSPISRGVTVEVVSLSGTIGLVKRV